MKARRTNYFQNQQQSAVFSSKLVVATILKQRLLAG